MSAKIKICGIKSLFEARAVLDCQAGGKRVDFVGLIFAPSKRRVSEEAARDISNLAREAGVKAVGVFVGQSAEQIARIARECNLAAVQIYEDLDFSNLNDNKDFKFEIWRAFSVGESLPDISNLNTENLVREVGQSREARGQGAASPLSQERASLAREVEIKYDLALFDAAGANKGGNGVKFEWSLLSNLNTKNSAREAEQVTRSAGFRGGEPRAQERASLAREIKNLKWGLAGGLSEKNAREALKYRPYLLDFNSRIEDENGLKIPEKIKEILKINGENDEY